MQITIDTARDSKEEIKKAIAFLQGFVGSEDDPSPAPLMGMFDQPEKEGKQTSDDLPATDVPVKLTPY